MTALLPLAAALAALPRHRILLPALLLLLDSPPRPSAFQKVFFLSLVLLGLSVDMKLHEVLSGAGHGRVPLVVLHGLLGKSRNWGSLQRALSVDRLVSCVDLRHHGHSTTTAAEHSTSVEVLADDVRHTTAQHSWPSVSVLGHSLGGRVAMHCALHRLLPVHTLLVADMAPASYGLAQQTALFDTLIRMPLHRLTQSRDALLWLTEQRVSQREAEFILTNVHFAGPSSPASWKIPIDTLRNSLPAFRSCPDYTNVEPFDGPTLFIGGANSDYITKDHEPEIKRLFPRAQITHLANAGHWVHADQPHAFLALVREFLSSHEVVQNRRD